ncbi:MAG: sterol desaturase family protein [Solirubrobacteraceae bacterium]
MLDYNSIGGETLLENLYGVLKVFFTLFTRYIFLSGIILLFFYVWFKQNFKPNKIQDKYPSFKSILFEFRYSTLSLIVFSLMITFLFLLRKNGYTQIYVNISEMGYGYFLFSTVFLILAHDTYFYWMHRAIHHPKLFNLFHKVHHESYNPTPMATFSFHPFEAFTEFLFIILMSLLLPLNPLAIAIFSLWSILFNVAGHLGFEFFPSGFTQHPFWKWMNTSTHHNLHHQKSNRNFGIYFNFWDRIMKTNHKKYHEYFESVKAKSNNDSLPVNGSLKNS